jgi:hypothetical protein
LLSRNSATSIEFGNAFSQPSILIVKPLPDDGLNLVPRKPRLASERGSGTPFDLAEPIVSA